MQPARAKIDLCNGGIMALAGKSALAISKRIGDENRKHEIYLTDAVEIARGMKLRAVAVEAEEDDVRGINTKANLPRPKRSRKRACARPRSTPASRWSRRRRCFSPPTPNSARTSWSSPMWCSAKGEGRGWRGHPLVLASRRRPCRQGRFGRALCAAAARHALGEGLHIGNFVEVKEAVMEAGAKANH